MNVRKSLCASIALALIAAVSVFAFDPDELNKITFTNNTGTKIEMIFLSPGDSNFWGPDLVGADYVIKDGGSIGYYVHYPETTFKFDIMATDDQGNRFEMRDFALTDGKEAKVSLTKKNLNATAPDFILATVKVTNYTAMRSSFCSSLPTIRSLGSRSPGRGNHARRRRYPQHRFAVGTDKVKYNLMAVDENNDEYQFDMSLDPNKSKSSAFQ